MIEITLHEAETTLPDLVASALEGENVVIACDTTHKVRLVRTVDAVVDNISNELLASIDDRELNHYLG